MWKTNLWLPKGKGEIRSLRLTYIHYYGGQEEKGTTEDEMAGWHHRLDGHEFE